ncbi:unnamed protein product [Didymodactylos carnosus]|uniref:Ion transport N-terminal domain-containing protein n=1 Tax=Didymodactylos carnosus TaxID=1234261 RepID=A0A814BJQ2_9BILA|nr:unnamed protein product [Didymodactylos carnosus]CAF1500797.1 unnamed protein product [Didymodactylos carnosus]CAF3708638.1 unnamed protein product [Didymodactylos carnosus]CAF4289234.1 unnamed protein product [Didymodactylos carnosus]
MSYRGLPHYSPVPLESTNSSIISSILPSLSSVPEKPNTKDRIVPCFIDNYILNEQHHRRCISDPADFQQKQQRHKRAKTLDNIVSLFPTISSQEPIRIIHENCSYPIDVISRTKHTQSFRRYIDNNDNSDNNNANSVSKTSMNRMKLNLPNDLFKKSHAYRRYHCSSPSEAFTLSTNPPIMVTVESENEIISPTLCENSLIAPSHICDEKCIMLNDNSIDANDIQTNLNNTRNSYSHNFVSYFMDLLKPGDNKLAMKLFGSKKGVLKERLRQQRAGYCIIHPCSSFRYVLQAKNL